MECLKGYIGLRGCGLDTAVAYINELPGISLRTIDNVADSEQVNYLGVWQDIESRSLRKFKTDVNNTLNTKYRLNKVSETYNLGNEVDTTTTEAGIVGEYRGFYAEYFGSSLNVINVQSISVYSDGTNANKTVKIYEVSDTNIFYELFSVTLNLVDGWNLIPVNKQFAIREMFVGVENLTSVKTKPKYLDTGNVYIKAATYDGTLVKNGTDTHGVSAIFSLGCEWDAFVCNNKAQFTQALLMLYGVELMNERIHSQRLNQYTLFGADKARELRDNFVEQYQTELLNVLNSLDFDCDECINVNSVVNKVWNL